MESLGERIVFLRKLFNLTQAALAEKIFVSDKVISKWERGDMPSVDELRALSDYFKVSLDYLVYGKANENDKQVLSKEPTDEEKSANEKKAWIKQCNSVMKRHSLYSYKELIFPANECEQYLRDDADKCKGVGIFLPICHGDSPLESGIDLKKLLAFDNYALFEKIVKTGLPFYCDNNLRLFYKKPLSIDDINGSSDLRFYALLANQDLLIENSLYHKGVSLEDFKKENDIEPYIKQILNEALEKLDRTTPKYWEIVKLLIEKGGCMRKLIEVKYKSDGDSGLEMVFTEDKFLTDCIYELALSRSKDKK